MTNITTRAKLLAEVEDGLGYTSYVFECLDEDMMKETRYIVAKKFPNWDHRNIEIGETGFLTFTELRAGVSTWFDGEKMIPYQYNDIQFIQFIAESKKPGNFVV